MQKSLKKICKHSHKSPIIITTIYCNNKKAELKKTEVLKIKLRKKILTLFLGFCCYVAYGGIIYNKIPDSIVSIEGENISLRSFAPELAQNSVSVSESANSGRSFARETESTVKICGIIPLKTVSVTTMPAVTVIPCGDIVGIKLYTDGVAVVATDSFTSGGREYSPALRSGVKPGDIISSVNGKDINTALELQEEINRSSDFLTLTVKRDGKTEEIKIRPERDSATGTLKLGLWVRDSCAGIGTLTFYRPDTGQYAALGHGLTDGDTGLVYPSSGGELVSASVLSVTKGKKGVPGELCGVLSHDDTPLGNLQSNTGCGISGTLVQKDIADGEKCTIAPRDSVKCGKAYILSCVGGTDVDKYEIEIERVCDSGEGSSKDMLIRVTDKELLEKTGGIVQGMSGSPIMQEGRLIGAVTHVFVNDPERGYGIFVDKMLSEAEKNK